MPERKRDGQGGEHLLAALVGLLTVYLACDPDAPARWAYRARLWLAYHRRPVSDAYHTAYLARLRDRIAAGDYRGDRQPTEITMREAIEEALS